MFRGRLDLMQWESIQPDYPPAQFKALTKEFNKNKSLLVFKLMRVRRDINDDEYNLGGCPQLTDED